MKYLETLEAKKQEAQLFTIMAISKARQLGFIKKRNLIKLDQKVNEAAQKFLNSAG